MTDREKNLIFCALVLACILLIGGLRLTDLNLNRMLIPDEEIHTISLLYEHGVTLSTGQQLWRPGALHLFGLAGDEENIILSIKGAEIIFPRYFTLGALSDWLRLTN